MNATFNYTKCLTTLTSSSKRNVPRPILPALPRRHPCSQGPAFHEDRKSQQPTRQSDKMPIPPHFQKVRIAWGIKGFLNRLPLDAKAIRRTLSSISPKRITTACNGRNATYAPKSRTISDNSTAATK